MRDSLQAAPATTAIPHPSRQAFNPKAIIESLPADATPAQQDSAIQAQLPKRERIRSTRPDTLNLPGWHVPSGKLSLKTLDISYGQNFAASSPYGHPEIPFRPAGIFSAPLPYQLRQDNGVTGILLCCFLVTAVILGKSKKHIRQHLKDLFLNRTKQESNLSPDTGQEIRHSVFLYLQNGLLAGLLFFAYTQATRDLFMSQVSSHILLGAYTLICWGYLGIKQLFYQFTNWVFFNKTQRTEWNSSYSFLISAEGILFFPLALTAVFSHFPLHKMMLYSCILLVFIRLLIFYKSYCLFFPKFHGLLHLIVYFCGLEMLPLCGLWQALIYTNDILL